MIISVIFFGGWKYVHQCELAMFLSYMDYAQFSENIFSVCHYGK